MNSLNVINNKSKKEVLLDLVGKILDIEAKRKYSDKLNGLILEEEDKSFKINVKTHS